MRVDLRTLSGSLKYLDTVGRESPLTAANSSMFLIFESAIGGLRIVSCANLLGNLHQTVLRKQQKICARKDLILSNFTSEAVISCYAGKCRSVHYGHVSADRFESGNQFHPTVVLTQFVSDNLGLCALFPVSGGYVK